MNIARLAYLINNENHDFLYLESLPLSMLDQITSCFNGPEELRYCFNYDEKIKVYLKQKNLEDDGIFKVVYIDNAERKEILPVLYKENNKNTDFKTEDIKEIKKARALMWSSKNEKYLEMFLENERLKDTLYKNIKLYKSEFETLKENNRSVYYNNNEDTFYTNILNILEYKKDFHAKGAMREVFEDSLELWKMTLLDLDKETRHYYARELKILREKYEQSLTKEKPLQIKNLKVNQDIASYNLKCNIPNLEKRKALVKPSE